MMTETTTFRDLDIHIAIYGVAFQGDARRLDEACPISDCDADPTGDLLAQAKDAASGACGFCDDEVETVEIQIDGESQWFGYNTNTGCLTPRS